MSDIRLILQAGQGAVTADLAFLGDDLETGHDLETAVLISLFSERVASPDFDYGASVRDPRGWWADAYAQTPIGSRLWQFARTTRTTETRLALIDAVREALNWLVDDGVASRVDVDAYYAGKSGVMISINITQQNGTLASLQYSFVWAGI